MTAAKAYGSENSFVEKPTIELMASLGWETVNAYEEHLGLLGSLGRESRVEVVMAGRLSDALRRLNPDVPEFAFDEAIEQLTRDRSAMSLGAASRDVYKLLKGGAKIEICTDHEELKPFVVRFVDWDNPDNNDFLLVSQFWVAGEMYTRRADLVGFVNGIPLLLFELKASHKNVRHAYEENLRDYKNTIPQLFWYVSRIILSNGWQSRIGSVTAGWEHFAEWKRINSEGEKGKVSLETMVRGTCDPVRLLDQVENFTVYLEAQGGTIHAIAKNHQVLGVNNSLDSFRRIRENQGRLGVFWHTQGSGKSISMIFFAQKILRRIPGHWSFLIVTDRMELDDQIFKNFAAAGAISVDEKAVRAQSREDLKEKLRGNNRYIFTLIQKFGTERGQRFAEVSSRSDIIVITDEAHRSQYDTLAMNMRTALPNAAFIAFTGTPLISGEEERTRQVFGDYVSIYNFSQSIEDGATVPLYYENRIPELQLSNENLGADLDRILEDAELDDAQQEKLEREFAREYHLITRDDRLEKIAEDVVAHFMGRGYRGKAMFIAIDKATAVRMYDRVRKHWLSKLAGLQADASRATGDRKDRLIAQINYMTETDMAVVVSQSQNEIEELQKKGADIKPHRKRMVSEDLDKKFKDPDDLFRLVFVCAMWMTGFDVPSCSTIYLDKPMRNHTLMQTIARANRVYADKVAGLIVDYIGVFRNLQRALAIYGAGPGGGETPVTPKEELVEALRNAVSEALVYCSENDVPLDEMRQAEGFDYVALMREAVERIVVNDETKTQFRTHVTTVDRLFKAVLPDPVAHEFGQVRRILLEIRQAIEELLPPVDISYVTDAIDKLLDESIQSYVITEPVIRDGAKGLIDLSTIDFEALRQQFERGQKHTEAERLQRLIKRKLQTLVALNRTRIHLQEKLEKLIEEYNEGIHSIDQFFEQLVTFARDLNEEETRHVKEQLTEEELAIFDILMKPSPEMTVDERNQVKDVAKELLDTLKREKLVLDWRKKPQTRSAVRVCISEKLDLLPQIFDKGLFDQKCARVWEYVYEVHP